METRDFENDLIEVSWAIDTCPTDVIIQNFIEDFGVEPTDEDWDLISDTIRDFESHDKDMVEKFIETYFRNEGHGSYDELVGCGEATLEQIKNIMEQGEQVDGNSWIFNMSSGSWNPKEADFLHQSVYADIMFYIPEDVVEYIENL